MKAVKYISDGKQVHTIIYVQLVYTDNFKTELEAWKFANCMNDPRIISNEKPPRN